MNIFLSIQRLFEKQSNSFSNLLPDSKKTETLSALTNFSIIFFCSLLFLGKKPLNENFSISKPETHNAAITDVAPGIGEMHISFAIASETRYLPGSETRGVPASLINAIFSPSFNFWIKSKDLLFSENL